MRVINTTWVEDGDMSLVLEDYPIGIPVQTLAGDVVIARKYQVTGKKQRIPRLNGEGFVLYRQVKVLGEITRRTA